MAGKFESMPMPKKDMAEEVAMGEPEMETEMEVEEMVPPVDLAAVSDEDLMKEVQARGLV